MKIVFLSVVLAGTMLTSFADRGITKKSKNKVSLNVNTTNTNFYNNLSLNLKSGLKYRGSLTSSAAVQTDNNFSLNSLITYKKGNSVYILPVKQKVLVSETRAGYSGMKLIIKAH